MKKPTLLIILTLCFNLHIFSQNDLKKVKDSVKVLITLSDRQNLKANFNGAFEYATLAVKHANTKNDKILQGRAYVCLANTYQMVNDNEKAEKYFQIALTEGKKTENYFLTIASLNGLGNVYSQDIETIDKAANYFEQSVKYALEANNIEHSFITYLNICDMYLDFKEADKAYPFIIKSQAQLAHVKRDIPLYFALLNIDFAKYNMLKGFNEIALTYVEKAREIAEKNNLNLDLIDIYELKSKIQQQQGDYDLAITSIEKKHYYKDLNFNADKNLQIEKIKAEFEVNEFKNSAKISKAETSSTIIIAICAVLLLSSFFLIFYLYKKRLAFIIIKKHNKAILEAKNEAERINTLKSELLVNISHELRTPLYGVVGITAMLLEDTSIKSEQQSLLNSLKFSGDHLQKLVNNILRINQVESNNVKLSLGKANLYSLVDSLVNSLKFQANQHDNELVLKMSKDVSKIYNIDESKISEILIKLIDNAIKYTNNGTIIIEINLIKSEEKSDSIEFKVTDTGIGISKKNQTVIFDTFKQASLEENTTYGLGLGLPIVKSLIEMMGSILSINSTVDVGSQFSFILECETANKDLSSQLINRNKALNILVAEDNKINQMVSQKLITSLGHNCTIAKNGLEAVDFCSDSHFDLIFMDLNMPIMNGFEASKIIKSQNSALKIIALTALEISEVKERCLRIGIDDVINKPINKKYLKDIIEIYVTL